MPGINLVEQLKDSLVDIENMTEFDKLRKAVELKIAGWSYEAITEALQMKNTPALRRKIKETISNEIAVFTANVEIVFAMDLQRLESMIPGNLLLAQQGSDKHVAAMIRIIKTKQELLKDYIELMRVQEEEMGDDPTFRSDSDEYMVAARELNKARGAEVIDIAEEAEEEGEEVVVPEDMLSVLREQLEDLELAMQVKAKAEGQDLRDD